MAVSRIVFMGTPELAAESLKALVQSAEVQVVAVVTRPDQPKGRGLKLQPSPVKQIARQRGLPVLQPERVRDEPFIRELRSLQPDLIVVAAYGQLLPGTILELPRHGCINVHASLLPKYRGAAPIQHALLNGDTETGVTIMKMDAGMDTGAILTREIHVIQPDDDASTLHDHLARMGADLLVRTIPRYVSGELKPRPQPGEGISYAQKIRKQDGCVDWRQPARAIGNRIRALVPWPGAFTHLPAQPQPVLLKLWRANVAAQSGPPGEVLCADRNGIVVGCGSDALRILALQREGCRRMTAPEFLAGHPLVPGQKLG